MKQSLKKIIYESEGQSVVELCIMLPFILFLILCTISVGLLIYSQLLVTFASGQAVDRAAEIMGDSSKTYAQKVEEVEDVANAYLSNGISGTDRNVDISIDGEQVTVTVEYEFKFIFLFAGEIFGYRNSVTVDSTAVDFIE